MREKQFRVIVQAQYEDEYQIKLAFGISALHPEIALVRAGVRVGRRAPGATVLDASISEDKHSTAKIIDQKST